MKTKSLSVIRRMKRFILAPAATAAVVLALGCADQHQRSAGESIDDEATSRRVQNALSSDPSYKYTEVKVATYQGKVQLSGFVDKDEQKEHAADVAKKTPGVKEVRNNIVLK
jgi:osmotically-inducible protein OsmY